MKEVIACKMSRSGLRMKFELTYPDSYNYVQRSRLRIALFCQRTKMLPGQTFLSVKDSEIAFILRPTGCSPVELKDFLTSGGDLCNIQSDSKLLVSKVWEQLTLDEYAVCAALSSAISTKNMLDRAKKLGQQIDRAELLECEQVIVDAMQFPCVCN